MFSQCPGFFEMKFCNEETKIDGHMQLMRFTLTIATRSNARKTAVALKTGTIENHDQNVAMWRARRHARTVP